LFRRFDAWRFRRRVRRALALNTRGEVRADGLELVRLDNRLEVEWRARDVHPWDRAVPGGEPDAGFCEQLLDDTEAAVLRLFEALPEVNTIDVRVVRPSGGGLLAAGTVHRASVEQASRLRSVGMRLRCLGITYRFEGAG